MIHRVKHLMRRCFDFTSLDPTNNYDGWVLSRIGVEKHF